MSRVWSRFVSTPRFVPESIRGCLRTLHLAACRSRCDLRTLRDCTRLRALQLRRAHSIAPGALDLSPLSSCRHLVHLQVTTCSFETPKVDVGSGPRGALDLEPLRSCGALRHLSLPGASGLVVDPLPVLDLGLEVLEWVSELGKVGDPALRSSRTLTRLGARGATLVGECAFAAGLPRLASLTLKGCTFLDGTLKLPSSSVAALGCA